MTLSTKLLWLSGLLLAVNVAAEQATPRTYVLTVPAACVPALADTWRQHLGDWPWMKAQLDELRAGTVLQFGTCSVADDRPRPHDWIIPREVLAQMQPWEMANDPVGLVQAAGTFVTKGQAEVPINGQGTRLRLEVASP